MNTSSNGSGITRRTAIVASGAAALFAANARAAGSLGPVMKTKAGRVQGEQVGDVMRFLGIPYGQSIAGRNRFKPPQPVKPWAGVRKAVRYAQSAPQPKSNFNSPVDPAFAEPAYVVPGDDCLALNVWTRHGVGAKLPVMVWLHGGGWTSGSGSCPVYDGANLANRGDVVVVTVNHRLGASGYVDFSRVVGGEFAHSSNLGMRDIIAALQWVRDNISQFGGDPGCVTIFGESGGGWKVSTMLGIPSAEGLFHRAVVESGPLTSFLTPDQADDIARKMLEALGLTPKTADKLNNISFEKILDAQEIVSKKLPMVPPGFPAGFWPVIDGEILPGNVFFPKAAPSSLDVPTMVGQNGTEMSLFMLADKAAYSQDDAQLTARVTKMFGADKAPEMLATYRRDFPNYSPSGLWFRILSDFMMGTLSLAILDARAVPAPAPIYAYRFEWQTPIAGGILHSPHTIEIPFVFDNANGTGKVMTGGGPEVAALAKTVSSAWVEFAKTGKPGAAALPDWPAYSIDGRAAMHLDTKSEVGPFMDSNMAALYREKIMQSPVKM